MNRLLSVSLLLISSISFAHQGGGGHGGSHGEGYGGGYGGGYNHGGYNNSNGYHHYHNNNVWIGGAVYDGGWDDDVWDGDGLNDNDTNVVVGVPDEGYYDPSCQTIQQCNSLGECVTEQQCN